MVSGRSDKCGGEYQKMKKGDKWKKVLGVIVILAIIVAVFSGAVSAEDVSRGLKQSVVDKAPSKDNTILDEEYGVVPAEDVSEGLNESVEDAEIQTAFAEDKIQSLNSQTEIFVGQGFDKCEIPTLSQMQNWITNSPYGAVNLYIGGSCRSCPNSALTASYVSQLSQQGWKFIPTWVGPQSACWGGSCGSISNDPATAYNQGISEANAAIGVAIDLGLALADGSGTIIYYDLEGYDTTNTACRNAAKSFISGWTAQLHARGSYAGVYGSACSSAISDFATISNIPDAVWAAHWLTPYQYRPDATVWDVACLSNGLWVDHQRIRQYAGGHGETWGSVTLIIDCNVIDGIVASVGDKFNIGDTVRVTTNLNVRTGPGTSYPEITDPDYPGYAPAGTIGTVLSGPSSADSFIWWEVNYGPGLYSGWSVEGGLEKVDDNIRPTVDAFSVTPASVTLGDSFTVSYTVSDTGGSGLKQVELWRKGTGSWEQIDVTSLVGEGDGPYSNSFYDAPTSVGTYLYGIHVQDIAGNEGLEPDPPGPIEVEVTPVNQPPTLSNGYVTPASGDTSTTFDYYVTYTDSDGDAPTTKYVYVDGSPHMMTMVSGSYTSGATFKYSTTLSAGSHNYYFYFDDGHSHTKRLPTSGTYSGPTVCGNMGVNPTTWSPPTLNCGESDSQIVTVSATGGTVEGVTVSKISGETWLSLSQTNLGDIPSGSSETFTMTAAPPSETSGDFTYTVRVSNTCGSPSSRDVTGTIHVECPDTTPPSAVTDLATIDPTSNSIKLTWTAPGDDGNTGTATTYDIRYLEGTSITESEWASAIQCTDEPSPNPAGSAEAFVETGLSPDTTYYFALKTADEVPNWSPISNSPSGTTEPGEVSIISIDPSSSKISAGSTTKINLTLDKAPNGLSGYNLTVSLSKVTVAEIVSVSFPSWATLHDNSTLPAGSIWMKAADLSDQVKSGATDINLGTLTLRGDNQGTSDIVITVTKMDDDNGYPINPNTISGQIEVTSVIPIPGHTNPPTDPDSDGLYEDLNGNGMKDFDDVVQFFKYMEWIEDNEPIACFDFNGNGLIDFADIVTLFKEV
ncbi:PKD repeat-containing protein [Methanophagales archaeon]|nr:PKD repeat-containing protein [Methanophagales archaeon]